MNNNHNNFDEFDKKVLNEYLKVLNKAINETKNYTNIYDLEITTENLIQDLSHIPFTNYDSLTYYLKDITLELLMYDEEFKDVKTNMDMIDNWIVHGVGDELDYDNLKNHVKSKIKEVLKVYGLSDCSDTLTKLYKGYGDYND